MKKVFYLFNFPCCPRGYAFKIGGWPGGAVPIAIGRPKLDWNQGKRGNIGEKEKTSASTVSPSPGGRRLHSLTFYFLILRTNKERKTELLLYIQGGIVVGAVPTSILLCLLFDACLVFCGLACIIITIWPNSV